MTFPEARDLLLQAGYYFYIGAIRGDRTALETCLALDEQVLGPEHPDTLSSINNLALLYWNRPVRASRAPLPAGTDDQRARAGT